MTLILTELTTAGIVMVADSAISDTDAAGKAISLNKTQWDNLFKVSVPGKLRAGVSYWGYIGRIAPRGFPGWLRQRVTAKGKFDDLPSLASYLAAELNQACGGVPLPAGIDVGLHVAGYAPWADNELRPTVFHVHNRDSALVTRTVLFSARDEPLVREQRLEGGRMGLFEARQNFPNAADSVRQNLAILSAPGGFLLRNGDYGPYSVVNDKLNEAFAQLNTINR